MEGIKTKRRMKKLILSLILGVFALSGYAQMNTFGGIGLRVNDTTTYQTNAAAYHAAGYRDMYFNNQATNKHFDIWNGSSYQHVFTFGGGSSGGSGTVNSGTAGQLSYYAGTGTAVSGATTGTGILTALGVNVGSAGAPVLFNGALGTPSSGTLTNTTGLPIVAGTTGTLTIARGGTNLTALGTSLQAIRVNAGVTALEYYTPGGGSGDFVGPASSVDNRIVSFDGITGKLGKDSGIRILANGTAGIKITAIGDLAGNSNSFATSDGFNTVFGNGAGAALTGGANSYDGSYNTFFGRLAGAAVTTGLSNTLGGYRAGAAITTGLYNTVWGTNAYRTATTQGSSTVMGYDAGSLSTSLELTTVGYNSFRLSSGVRNSGLGWGVGAKTTTGQYNLFLGSEAGQENVLESNNVYAGFYAGVYNRGGDNVFVGYQAGGQATVLTGSITGGVFIGANAGITNTGANYSVSGANDTYVGYQTGLGSTTQVSGSTALGYRAKIYTSNSMVFGSEVSGDRVNYGFGGEDYGGGQGVIHVKDAISAPTGNPTAGFRLYSNAGAATLVNSTGSAFPLTDSYWPLTGSKTLTGAVTITSNAANQHLFAGTWTSTANNQYHMQHGGTVTMRATASDRTDGYTFPISIASGNANAQTATGLLVNPTFTSNIPSGANGLSSAALRIQPTWSGTVANHLNPAYFDIIDPVSSTRALYFGKPQGDPANASNNIFSFYGGTSNANNWTTQINSSSVSLFSGTNSSVLITGGTGTSHTINAAIGGRSMLVMSNIAGVANGQGTMVQQITTGNPTNTATQVSSNFLGVQTNNWNGAASALNRFHFQSLASTASNSINDLQTGYNGTVLTTLSQTGNLGINTVSPNSKVHIAGSFAAGYVAKTATYTADITDFLIDCTANSFTVTLPTAVGITGRIYIIKNSGSATTITIATTSSQTIDGTTPGTLTSMVPIQLMSTGANWITIK